MTPTDKNMTLEEIRELSDEDLGANIYCAIYGYKVLRNEESKLLVKVKSDDLEVASYEAQAQLCSSLDAVSEVEEIVVEKVGVDSYYAALNECFDSWDNYDGEYQVKYIRIEDCMNIVMANARQRSEASLLALQENS